MYGTLIRFSGGANTATISQFRTNSATRMVMKRRGLHGIIGGFFGAPLTRRFPRCGSGGGGGVRGSGARASSAMRPMLGGEVLELRAMKQQLRPLFDQVVIKELDPDRVRRSGLLLPPGEHETPPQHGIVLAVGPGLDWWGGVGIKMPVAPGDHVVFPGSAGVWVEIEEERLLVCRVGMLLGVLEEHRRAQRGPPRRRFCRRRA